MADTIYTVSQDDPNNIPGFENYSQSDLNLLSEYQVNNLFDTNKHFVELYITDLNGEIIEADSKYTSYKLLGNAQSAGKEGASILTINPIEDSKAYGYETGGVKLLYHFLNDLYTEDSTTSEFYITSISPDRTELQLQNLNLTNEQLVSLTSTIKDKLSSQSYYNEFRLDFGNNDLLIGINIDNLLVGENQTVVVKLYEPLPGIYEQKSTLNIVEIISDSIAFEVDATFNLPEVPTNSLRPANFNLDTTDDHVVPSQYFNYTELFSYPISNANNQIYSLFNEKGVEISIDHSDYSNFIHFSSAQERLMNFKYKLQLIENYSSSLSQINNATSQSVGITGSVAYYEGLTQGVVSNFDHYERFLYYESSSYAWPKSNRTRPYNNVSSSNPIALNWYANQLTEATRFDASNYNALINTIPSFLRDDTANDNYLIFVYMIGQHFDTIWQYTQAVTDKYDGDNRLDFGISKDLVGEALKNFGVKLYTSNNSIEDLFGSFIGQAYQSGSEDINFYITGSLTGSNTPIQPSSYDNYNKEVQKRIYHNLSHLVKTKGTERGLRALINCFGIPSDILKIKLYGGRNVDKRPFYGDFQYYTSSLDKIRLDHTGSLITGSTLSSYTSIYKRDPKYTDDLHTIEVGFSPTDNIDNYIVSYSLATGSLSSFNIDNYIGDPRNLTLDSYALLSSTGTVADTLTGLTNRIMSGSNAYDVFDYVRLIKFFDNTIFKMVRDFIPARVTADTGIIIKPHLLQRNKAKSVSLSGSRTELSASIDTAFIQGSHGSVFDSGSREWSTRYLDTIQAPTRLVVGDFLHDQEQPKYNGELSGSNIVVTRGNLTANNPYLVPGNTSFAFNAIQYVSSSATVCLLVPYTNIQYVTSSTQQFEPISFFNIGTSTVAASNDFTYTITSPAGTVSATPLFTFGNYPQYSQLTLTATDTTKTPLCSANTSFTYGTCSIMLNNNVPSFVGNQAGTNLTSWFRIHPLQASSVQYTASWNSGANIVGIPNPSNYLFSQPEGTAVTIIVRDPKLGNICETRRDVTVGALNVIPITPPNARGWEFEFSEQLVNDPNRGVTDDQGNLRYNTNFYNFLGVPQQTSTAPGGVFSIATGIPGYFTTLNPSYGNAFPSTPNLPGDGQAPNIRYRVFAVGGTNGPNAYLSTGVPYTIVQVADLSPYASWDPNNEDYPPSWISAYVDAYQEPIALTYNYTNIQMLYYVARFQKTPNYSRIAAVGTADIVRSVFNLLYPENANLQNEQVKGELLGGRWPITIGIPPYNNIVYNNGNGVSQNIPKTILVRAYIIQAYIRGIDPNPQYNGTMSQVVVYANRGINNGIYNIENVNYPVNQAPKSNLTFRQEYLLVGHDYANEGLPSDTTSPPGEGNLQTSITSPPTNINYTIGSTWVKFPRRIFS